MRQITLLVMSLTTFASTSACDLGKVTVSTTSKVLTRAQPALKQESDYVLASRAIPGTLKTVEGFHMVDPENERLKGILAEGYCQYASGFIEDEWEVAKFSDDFEGADLHSSRATKSFLRCHGYALELLGSKWKKANLSDTAVVDELAAEVGTSRRDALMWAAIGLAGAINQNKDNPGMVAYVAGAKRMLERVVAIDDAHGKKDKALHALPHIALGMLSTSLPKALGGDAAKGKKHFERAMEITQHKFLLAKVLFARRYGVMTQDKELFESTLIEVLQTDPAIWPDQRLANEIAHRRAQRYLKHEKEWF